MLKKRCTCGCQKLAFDIAAVCGNAFNYGNCSGRRNRKYSVRASYASEACCQRRYYDLCGRDLLQKNAYADDISDCIHRAYFVEMNIRYGLAVSLALSLCDEAVYCKSIRLYFV